MECQNDLGFFIPSAIVSFALVTVACLYYALYSKGNFFIRVLFGYWSETIIKIV